MAEGRNHYPDNVCIPSTGVYISDQTSIEVAEGRNHYPDNVCIPSIGVYKRVDTKKRTCRRKERVEENDVSKKKTTSIILSMTFHERFFIQVPEKT